MSSDAAQTVTLSIPIRRLNHFSHRKMQSTIKYKFFCTTDTYSTCYFKFVSCSNEMEIGANCFIYIVIPSTGCTVCVCARAIRGTICTPFGGCCCVRKRVSEWCRWCRRLRKGRLHDVKIWTFLFYSRDFAFASTAVNYTEECRSIGVSNIFSRNFQMQSQSFSIL